MDRRLLYSMLAGLIMHLANGCGYGGSMLPPQAASAAGFTLNILPETVVHGAAECAWETAVEPTADGCIVNITVSGAAGQKALYFDLEYDAETLHPVTAKPVAGVADCEPLSIAVLDDRGTVHYGQILPSPDTRAGFSGDGVVATVEFKRGAALCSRKASGVPTNLESAVELKDTYPDSLYWRGLNVGDCNQDGLVSATDLTPIGIHFDPEAFYTPAWLTQTALQAVDTDGNALITVADITAIGRNFGNSILGGYRVYSSPDPTDYPATCNAANGAGASRIGAIAFSEGATTDPSRYLIHFSFTPANANLDTYYWVRPVDLDGNEGAASTRLTQLGLSAPRSDRYACNASLMGDGSTVWLRWDYHFPGDYNQDFHVTTSDLPMISIYYGMTGPFDQRSTHAIVDGNGDGIINMVDGLFITEFFDIPTVTYAVFASADPGDYPLFNDSAPVLQPLDTVRGPQEMVDPFQRFEFEYEIPSPTPGMYYWVRLVDEHGMCGTPSNMVGGV